MSFCERCFEEMPGKDGAFSTVCNDCRGHWGPDVGVIHNLYTKPPFGVWDHIRRDDSKPIVRRQHNDAHGLPAKYLEPMRTGLERRVHLGPAEREDHL